MRIPSEPSLYVKRNEEYFLMVCLYADDLIYAGTNNNMVDSFKKTIMQEYEMTDFGFTRYFLGIQVKQTNGDIFITQEKRSTFQICLKIFIMENCKGASTPMTLNEKLQLDDAVEKTYPKIYRRGGVKCWVISNMNTVYVNLCIL